MTELIAGGGALGPVVLGLGGLSLLVTLIFSGLALTRRRVPLAGWVLLPLLVITVGAFASWSGAGTALSQLASQEENQRASFAMTSVWAALGTDLLSRWIAAALFCAAAWGASLGSGIAAGPDKLWTFGAAALSLLFTVVGVGACGAFATMNQMGQGAYMLIGLLLMGGLAVSFAATRRALEDDMFRVAGMRFASAMCLMLSMSYGSRALGLGARMEVFGPGSDITGLELATAIERWNTLAEPVTSLGWMVVCFGALIAFFGIFAELGEIVARYTLIDVVVTLLLMSSLGTVRIAENWRIDQLRDVATHSAATLIFEDVAGDLAPAIIAIGEDQYQTRPVNGGFGDVLQYDDGTKSWTRISKWNGAGWSPDSSAFDSITLSPGRPLLVISGALDANAAMPVIDKSSTGEALLLMRAAEVRADIDIPEELKYLQVAFLPLKRNSERDLATVLWSTAGAREFKHGPTTWYGEGMDGKPVEYVEAAFKATESPGLLTVLNNRARIKGVVASCLPVIQKLENDAMVPSGRWCELTDEKVEDIVDAAHKAFPKPEPTNVDMKVKIEGVHDAKQIRKLLRREIGAFGYCQEWAKAEGMTEITGEMIMNVTITPKGKVDGIKMDEDTKLNNGGINKCVAVRIRPIKLRDVPEGPVCMGDWAFKLDDKYKGNGFESKEACDRRAKKRTDNKDAECECLKEEPEEGCRGCAFGPDAPMRGAEVQLILEYTDPEAK